MTLGAPREKVIASDLSRHRGPPTVNLQVESQGLGVTVVVLLRSGDGHSSRQGAALPARIGSKVRVLRVVSGLRRSRRN
jgi:hypothetical protein